MSDFILTQEQKNVLDKLGTLSNIVYDDIESAVLTMAKSITINVQNVKSSVIVVPDGLHRQMLKEQLNLLGIKELFLSCDPSTLVNEEDLSYLRTHISSDAISNNASDISSYIFNKQNLGIEQNLATLSQKVFGNKSWKELLYLYLSFEHDDRIYLLHSELKNVGCVYQEEEFNTIYQTLSEVLFLYDRDFEITDESSEKLGIKQSFLSEDKLQDATYELFTFKEMAQNIRNRYFKCLHEIEQNKRTELLQFVLNVKEELDFLAYKLEQFNLNYMHVEKKKSIFSTFKNSDKSMENDKNILLNDVHILFDLLKDKKLTNAITRPSQISDIHTFIDSGFIEVEKFQHKIDEKVALFLKSSNKLNASEMDLEELEDDFKSIILEINKSDIFKKPFELNTLSFTKQVECVTQLVQDIDVMLLMVDKNLAYYKWKSFYLSLEPKCQKIINVLRKIEPQDWLTVFEAWYYFEILNKHKNVGLTVDDEIFNEVLKNNDNRQRAQIFKAVNNWKSNCNEIFDELKISNSQLYNSINKRKKYAVDILWKHMIEGNTSFFSKLFPVLVVENDDFKNLPSGFYTELFYLDPKETNVDILQNFHTIHTYLDSNRVQNFKGDVHLTEMTHKIVQKISDYGMSERMPIIRNTVQCLLSCDKMPIIYHLRNASIISFANDNIHSHLERSLHHFGIKRIISDEPISDTLIATLLDVKKTVFVITEDFLINTAQFESYLNQRQKIKAISIAGCKILNIDHHVLMKVGNKLFDDISEMIAIVNTPKTDHKNQIEFEFS